MIVKRLKFWMKLYKFNNYHKQVLRARRYLGAVLWHLSTVTWRGQRKRACVGLLNLYNYHRVDYRFTITFNVLLQNGRKNNTS